MVLFKGSESFIATSSRKKQVSLFLSVAVILGLAGFLLWKKGISFDAILAAMGRFSPAVLAGVLGLALLQYFFMMLRVWVLCPRYHRVRLRQVAEAIAYGQFLNTFLPARAGDVVKAVLVSRGENEHVPVMTGAGVVIADKVVDILSLLSMILLTQAYVVPGFHFSWPQASPWWLVAIPVLGLGLYFGWRWLRTKEASKIKEWANHFLLGLVVFRYPRQMIPALCLGIGGWSCEMESLRLLCMQQGVSLTLGNAVFILLVLNLAIAVPISFANVGTFEASIVFALGLFGLSVTDGIAVGTIHHWAQLAGIALWALFMSMVKRFFNRSKPQTAAGPDGQGEFRVELEDKMNAIAYYDKISTDYDETVSKGILKYPRDRERNIVLKLAKFDRPGDSMIDVGCGAGFFALAAKKAGMYVHAVDTSTGMVMKLSGKVDEIEVADVETMEIERTFDRVVCAGVLDFVMNPEKAFCNLCRLVGPGGRLIILSPRRGLGGLFYRYEKKAFGIKRINLYQRAWYENLGKQCGLNLIECVHPLPTNMAVVFERP